jgi:YXWGXW repeat-containing protein
MIKRSIVGLCIVVVLSTPAFARVDINLGIAVAPPPPQVEVIPAPRPGYVWAPGYWAWQGGRHVWVAGRWIPVYRGYYWVPDRWVEYPGPRGSVYWRFEPGHWEREHRHRRY